MEKMEEQREPTIIITGFGPFKEHKINASWQSVKLLQEIDIRGCSLIYEELPVAYKAAEDRMKVLWETHSPDLVIHVGVSSKADKVTLETCANRTGYIKTDAFGNVHPTGYCMPPENGNDVLYCGLDVQKICSVLTENNYLACVSQDAGRFLCEYIYYKSLNMNRSKTLFVHVPVLDNPYSDKELAQCLVLIINEVLRQFFQCTS